MVRKTRDPISILLTVFVLAVATTAATASLI